MNEEIKIPDNIPKKHKEEFKKYAEYMFGLGHKSVSYGDLLFDTNKTGHYLSMINKVNEKEE